ncbi:MULTISPECIES: alpha/beta hydrolase family protein [Thalassobacillus]|uniref:alpha/beta hydrolase family protein n=1 Tax=Thalassobacillus TaxID=331971 RepID=UPI000A1CED9E|nr:prolyl oligopeptidase family serine peptidase [Thalassobacillus devorans]
MNGSVVDKLKFPSPHPGFDIYLVTYMSQGLKVKGFLVEPKEDRSYPGFLYLRGGIKNVGKVRIGRIIQFAAQGFIVFAPTYRGNMGGEGSEDFALNDRHDAYSGVRVLENHPKVKEDICVFGFSRGGVMALWTAIEIPQVKKVVVWGGVSDVTLTYWEREDLRRMMKRVTGGTPKKYPERYLARTPLHKLNQMEADLLVIHGEKDENVDVQHAYRLQEAMKVYNKRYESWIYSDTDHYFPPKINRETVEKLCAWLKQT